MSSSEPRPRTRRRLLAALAAVGLIVLATGPHAWAWYHLRTGKAALARYHPEEARRQFDSALVVWPGSSSVQLLASRAARQADDLPAAEAHLRAAHRAAGGATEETALEWALLQAAAGNVAEVDEYLQRRADADPAIAPLTWEAAATGFLRVYRTLDAMAILDHWLSLDPNNVRALELRGMTFVAGKGVQRGTDDFRRALELDPDRDEARWRLALALTDLGGYEEALGHLERLARARPDDPEVLARLARCQSMAGRPADAQKTLDAALARHPDDPALLRTRGQFALAGGRPEEAETWLRRAAAESPEDYQSQWLLFQALQQVGKDAEAKAQLAVAEDVKDRRERLGELRSRKLAERPLDPALHYEMGTLMLRAGERELGERWLLSALSLDPDYAPAHAALADVYDQAGDRARAAEHRAKAGRTAER